MHGVGSGWKLARVALEDSFSTCCSWTIGCPLCFAGVVRGSEDEWARIGWSRRVYYLFIGRVYRRVYYLFIGRVSWLMGLVPYYSSMQKRLNPKPLYLVALPQVWNKLEHKFLSQFTEVNCQTRTNQPSLMWPQHIVFDFCWCPSQGLSLYWTLSKFALELGGGGSKHCLNLTFVGVGVVFEFRFGSSPQLILHSSPGPTTPHQIWLLGYQIYVIHQKGRIISSCSDMTLTYYWSQVGMII